MEITRQEDLIEGAYYWVTYGEEQCIGKWEHAIGWHFSLCGSDEIFRFGDVSNIFPVCIFRH